MSPTGWIRYWTVGVFAAPVLGVVMAVRGEWAAVVVAVVVMAWSVRMVAVWRDRLSEDEDPPTPS